MENNVPMQLFFEAFLGHQPGGPPRADINDGGGLAGDAAGWQPPVHYAADG